jgi:hypothetical protein
VVDRERADRGVHALGHEALRLRVDHPVFFSEQIPRRLCLPRWCNDRLLDALHRDGPLDGAAERDLLWRCVLREGFGKALIGHPDESVPIGCKLRGCGCGSSR